MKLLPETLPPFAFTNFPFRHQDKTFTSSTLIFFYDQKETMPIGALLRKNLRKARNRLVPEHSMDERLPDHEKT
jgi:hypothetical protein